MYENKNDSTNKMPGKRWWRERIKELEAELTPEYIEAASLEIQAQVMADPAFQKAQTIMLYVSMDREVSTFRLIAESLAMKKRICVPLCTDLATHEMKAIEISSLDDLAEGAFGILEPRKWQGEGPDERVLGQGEIDYVVCPCVSCDLKGNRLGHGAGYYDRWLASYEGRKVALCFGKLLQYDIPSDENDVRMDDVIVERN